VEKSIRLRPGRGLILRRFPIFRTCKMTSDERPKDDRYDFEAMLAFAFDALVAAGMPGDKAVDVADVLLEAELLGRRTHGLRLLPWYVSAVREGSMAVDGLYDIVRDESSTQVWDGRHLPGPWLVKRAIAEAARRLLRHPVATVVIRRSHHTGGLQAYLEAVTEKGLMVVLANADRSGRVAPPGAIEGVLSPSPLAVGFPTEGKPVMIDMSVASTSVGTCIRTAEAGSRLPGPWLIDANGAPTDDPKPLVEKGEGAILPLGGMDLGYKGFALGLFIEALTAGLAGWAPDGPDAEAGRWGCSVFVQLIDPGRFSGLDAFRREMEALARACRAARVPEGAAPVHLPGEDALARKAGQLAQGLAVDPAVIAALRPVAEAAKLTLPSPLGPE